MPFNEAMVEEHKDEAPYITEMRRQRDELQAQLDKLNAMLAIHDRESAGPYARMRVIDAVLLVLEQHGKPIHRLDLTSILLKGGSSAGKSQPETNISRSLEQNKRQGKIVIDAEGMVGLPEWTLDLKP